MNFRPSAGGSGVFDVFIFSGKWHLKTISARIRFLLPTSPLEHSLLLYVAIIYNEIICTRTFSRLRAQEVNTLAFT